MGGPSAYRLSSIPYSCIPVCFSPESDSKCNLSIIAPRVEIGSERAAHSGSAHSTAGWSRKWGHLRRAATAHSLPPQINYRAPSQLLVLEHCITQQNLFVSVRVCVTIENMRPGGPEAQRLAAVSRDYVPHSPVPEIGSQVVLIAIMGLMSRKV